MDGRMDRQDERNMPPQLFSKQNDSFVLFDLVLYIPVNSYGHVRTVSLPNHIFSLGKLD